MLTIPDVLHRRRPGSLRHLRRERYRAFLYGCIGNDCLDVSASSAVPDEAYPSCTSYENCESKSQLLERVIRLHVIHCPLIEEPGDTDIISKSQSGLSDSSDSESDDTALEEARKEYNKLDEADEIAHIASLSTNSSSQRIALASYGSKHWDNSFAIHKRPFHRSIRRRMQERLGIRFELQPPADA